MKKIIMMVMAVALVGCAAQTSPQRHAKNVAMHAEETMNGNMRTDRNGIYQLALPKFNEIYAQGKADRAKGASEQEAKAYADAVRKEAQKQNAIESRFTGSPQVVEKDEASLKEATLWYNNLAETYLDGYNSVP